MLNNATGAMLSWVAWLYIMLLIISKCIWLDILQLNILPLVQRQGMAQYLQLVSHFSLNLGAICILLQFYSMLYIIWSYSICNTILL